MATAAGAERSRRSGPVTRHAPIRAFGGRIAAATLSALIAGRRPERREMLVTPELRVRATSCPPAIA